MWNGVGAIAGALTWGHEDRPPFRRVGAVRGPRRVRPTLVFTTTLMVCGLSVCASAQGMVDPSIDGLTGPFCYLSKPSTIIGGIGASGATQVTWDGAFYTGAFELCIVTGDPPRPVAARVKRLAMNYLPVLHYAWQEGPVRYSVSVFAGTVSEGAGPVNFIRLHARRMGEGEQPAFIGFGVRHSGLDHRARAMEVAAFDRSRRYEFAEGCAVVEGEVLCVLPEAPPTVQYAVVDQPYDGPYSGEAMGLQPTTATLIALWELGAAEELAVDLKMPWKPLPLKPAAPIRALQQASYDEEMQLVVSAWHTKLAEGMQIRLPEEKPQSAYRANVVSALVSIEEPSGKKPYVVNRLQRRRLYPGESAAFIAAIDAAGHHQLARGCLESLLALQGETGCLALGDDLSEHCAVIRAVAFHYGVTADQDFGDFAWPATEKALGWLDAAPSGTLPERLTRAAALAGAAEMAARLGHDERVRALHERLERAVQAVAEATETEPLPAEAVPAILSLAAVQTGPRMDEVAEVWPEQIASLCHRLRAQYAEGVMSRDGALDLLATADMARLHAMRGEQEQAIRDLYALLAHTGSCHEGFAAGVKPWSDRDSAESYPPDPSFAAAYVRLLRDLLVREAGRDLHLLSALSPEWLTEGKDLIVENARTVFGPVSVLVSVSPEGAEVLIAADWHHSPDRIILHLPYSVRVTQVGADQPGLRQVKGPSPRTYEVTDFPTAGARGGNDWLELPSHTTRVTIDWQPREVEPISYEATVEEWQTRYWDRYDRYIGSGKAPVSIEPVPLR